MENHVFLDYKVVGLKPKVLEFLTTIIQKAKDNKEPIVVMTRKDMANLIKKDSRTVTRYIQELEASNMIEVTSKRGRAGGTVIRLNTEMIRFESSTTAHITSEEIESLDEVVERKFPKKKKPPRKRNRRTKQQMTEDKVLRDKEQNKINELNTKVELMGGTPNWAWFQELENPVEDYRTYLLSRMYNRYALLFTDKHNALVDVFGEGNRLEVISDSYDSLPLHFYKSARWNQFEKLREFLDDNDIPVDVYLSSQFSRSIFYGSTHKKKVALPFINAMVGDTAYEAYLQYCEVQKKYSKAYASYLTVPGQFTDDFVISTIFYAYHNADKRKGMLTYRGEIQDFLEGIGADEKEQAVADFYRVIDKDMKASNLSVESRGTIKKYIIMQALTQLGGISRLPLSEILGMETVRATLMTVDREVSDKEQATEMKRHILGKLVFPYKSVEEQKRKGGEYYYQFNLLHETPKVIKLIKEQQGTYLGVNELNKAINEYGVDKLPIDDYSMLDLKQVVDFMENTVYNEVGKVKEEQPEVDLEAITVKQEHEWELVVETNEEGDPLADAFNTLFD